MSNIKEMHLLLETNQSEASITKKTFWINRSKMKLSKTKINYFIRSVKEMMILRMIKTKTLTKTCLIAFIIRCNILANPRTLQFKLLKMRLIRLQNHYQILSKNFLQKKTWLVFIEILKQTKKRILYKTWININL